MSKSKDKGRRLENMVVTQLAEYGIKSERVPLSGSLGGKYASDVVLGSIDHPLGRIECKNRESIADYFWDYLDPVDYLVIKKNHKEPLVVMRLSELGELLKAKQNGQVREDGI